jgi:carbamoyltransferase
LNVLGINSVYHESSACLIQDGRITAAVEEERFNRIKHAKRARVDNADELPWAAIDWCLKAGGVAPADVDHVAYSFDPEERLRRNLELPDDPGIPPGDCGTADGERVFYGSTLHARDLLQERFGSARFHFVPHHLAHAASAYLVCPFDEAAILSVDGIGEFTTTWMGLGEGNRVTEVSRINYPHSLGFLWEQISVLLGFDVYSGPGKVMGYAGLSDPMGESSGVDYLDRFRQFVHLLPDGTFEIDESVARFRTPDLSGLQKLFGARRPIPVDRYEDASVGAGLQAITDEVMIHLATHLYRKVNADRPPEKRVRNLCLAGGVALNCVTNHRLLAATPFEGLWVQPAANDAGTSVGAAAWVWNVVLGETGRPRMEHSYLGPSSSPEAIEAVLEESGLTFERPDDPVTRAVKVIEAGGLVAWHDGRLEFGPRALGSRSILADPSRFDTRSIINHKVKQRESFRPFAPSLLAEEAPTLFEVLPDKQEHTCDFMLSALPVRPGRYQQLIPAVVLQNLSTGVATARVHTVREEASPNYHRLLTAWKALSGRGILLNTSFNIQEPIICTPEQAVATFGRSGLDLLVLGPFTARKPKS